MAATAHHAYKEAPISWASAFIKHNRNFAGNLLKNVAPAAFLIPGIGAGAAAAIGGLGSALGRGIQNGANLGNIVKQGATGAGIAYGGAQGLGALKSAFAPSSSAAGTLAAEGGSAPGAFTSGIPGGGGWMSDAELAGTGSSVPGAASAASGMSKLGAGAKALGSFAKDNPTAIGMGLQGLGQIGTMGAENDYKRAQTKVLEQQGATAAADLEDRKRRAAMLQPILQALMSGRSNFPVAANPYA